jgi:hypothetical protein
MSKEFRIPVKILDEGQALKIVQAVKRVGMLNVYSRWYEYYRPILKARFDEGSKTTPYAESSLGKRKRSGEIIKQVPQSKFNQDTLKLYDSVTKDVKISNAGLDLETDVSYAPYALKHFTKKGSLAPDGLFKLTPDDIGTLELYLLEEYEDALGEIPDDLI